ncbi:uncharacterized protein B0T23DRAFT_399526 [Neurospora hispaniola]|uniref:Uncharacterized protein n=1 Tax=Neurospora hispaniola TaxID=588809 RepID=A0AAJ0HZY3_9PEZI|nr:hypothetical protein B0T23DRAFT_399526 [Neurospora hispaniola]
MVKIQAGSMDGRVQNENVHMLLCIIPCRDNLATLGLTPGQEPLESEMRPSIPHTLHGRQPALPTWSLQPKQYPKPQQLPTATPDLDVIPPRPWTQVTSVPALSIGGFQSQPQLEYKSDLGHLDELHFHVPSEKPYQSLHSPLPLATYRPYQPPEPRTNAPELQVKSLRRGCQHELFDIQHGMHTTSAPPLAPTCISLGLGVPLPLEEPEWTLFPSPSPLTPYTQPFSQLEQLDWKQLIMAGFQGQRLQVQAGGQQASSQPVQPSVRPAAQKRRMMLTEVEDDKGQEEERPAKKRRRRKRKWKAISWEVHVPASPSRGSCSDTGTPFGGI